MASEEADDGDIILDKQLVHPPVIYAVEVVFALLVKVGGALHRGRARCAANTFGAAAMSTNMKTRSPLLSDDVKTPP